MTGETYKHGYGPIPMGIVITILVVAVVATLIFSMTGNSGHGPPAEAGDSGGGIDISPANPAGVDPAGAASQVKPRKEVEVTLENWKSGKFYRMTKPGILYVCEDRESGWYRGFIILKNNEEIKEFNFYGTLVKVQYGRVSFESAQSDVGVYQTGYLSKLPAIPENLVETSEQGKYVCIEVYEHVPLFYFYRHIPVSGSQIISRLGRYSVYDAAREQECSLSSPIFSFPHLS